MKFPQTPLVSGGLITNYHCTSSCAHCLYYSSPDRSSEYIDFTLNLSILDKIKTLGCHSLHIGGGEPFMNFKALIETVKGFNQTKINIEYIESNGFWFNHDASSMNKLDTLKSLGIKQLLVSFSPFHNVRIPLKRTLALCEAANQKGINIFPWVDSFIPDLENMGIDSTHTLEEYMKVFGPDYLSTIPSRYWISFRGRALKTYSPYLPDFSLEEILSRNKGSCSELFSTSHFHIDLYGYYIPGLCPGLSIYYNDLPIDIPHQNYPYLSLLIKDGISAFYDYVKMNYKFIPKSSYKSKCDLCQDLRLYLFNNGVQSSDLHPSGFYEQMNKERSLSV